MDLNLVGHWSLLLNLTSMNKMWLLKLFLVASAVPDHKIKVHLEYNSKGYIAKCKPPAVPDVFLQTSSPAWLTGIPRRKLPDASSQDSPLNSRR